MWSNVRSEHEAGVAQVCAIVQKEAILETLGEEQTLVGEFT